MVDRQLEVFLLFIYFNEQSLIKKIFAVDYISPATNYIIEIRLRYLYEYLSITNQVGIYNIYDEVDYEEINTLPKFFEHNSV